MIPSGGFRRGSILPLPASGGSRRPSLGWWPPPSRLCLRLHVASPLCLCLSCSVSYEDPVLGFTTTPGDSDSKESTCNAGDRGSIPVSGKSPGGGHGNPLQYSCLEHPHEQRSLAGYSPWGRKESARHCRATKRQRELITVLASFQV